MLEVIFNFINSTVSKKSIQHDNFMHICHFPLFRFSRGNCPPPLAPACGRPWRYGHVDWLIEILFVGTGNGWLHNVPRYHYLMPTGCNFRDCKSLLVTSLTHVSSAIASYLDLYVLPLPLFPQNYDVLLGTRSTLVSSPMATRNILPQLAQMCDH